MGCDYYIQTDLVILYYDDKGSLSTTTTNRMLEKGYIFSIKDDDSEDDEETRYNKLKADLQRRIEKNTYKQIVFENNKWVKESYEKKYSKELNILCPMMVKLCKIYKDVNAWERR